jgi:hypothetical protein
MPRYVIEREFPDPLDVPTDESGACLYRQIPYHCADEGVTWLHSYVTPDRKRSFCVFDGPSPDAIRRAATRSRLPVHAITHTRVLSPDSYL